MHTGTLIVPDRSDLNIYKSANEDSKGAGCCGPANQGKSSCCGSKEAIKDENIPDDVDLNEWAGESAGLFDDHTRVKLT